MSTRPDIQHGAQIEQDRYVLALLGGKRNGTFVDIGCGTPTINSNTFLLESEYGWSGIAIDVLDQWDSLRWADRRAARHIVADAATIEWANLFSETFTSEIDFLSLDLEPPAITFDVLWRCRGISGGRTLSPTKRMPTEMPRRPSESTRPRN